MSHLGSFSPEALEAFQNAVAGDSPEFAEGETYDFTRCVRADGSHYGTGGTCRKGTETGEKVEPKAEGAKGNIPILTKEDMGRMSVDQLKAVKKAMDERAFGKDSAPLTNTQLQGMSDQNKRINEELARRGASSDKPGRGKVSDNDALKLKSSLEKQISKASKDGDSDKVQNLMSALSAVTDRLRERGLIKSSQESAASFGKS